MPIEDELTQIVKRLNHLLRENDDVDNQPWWMCLARGTTYIENSLKELEKYNVVEEEINDKGVEQ